MGVSINAKVGNWNRGKQGVVSRFGDLAGLPP